MKDVKTIIKIEIAVLALILIACLAIIIITPLDTLVEMVPRPTTVPTPKPQKDIPSFEMNFSVWELLYWTVVMGLMFFKPLWWLWLLIIALAVVRGYLSKK